jgi:hypothetical protein
VPDDRRRAQDLFARKQAAIAEVWRERLGDWPKFLKRIAVRNISPHPVDYRVPWIDCREGSVHDIIRGTIEDCIRNTKSLLVLAPRGWSFKSTILDSVALRIILRDKEATFDFGGENEGNQVRRLDWIRGRLEACHQLPGQPFGALVTRDWSTHQLTVNRPSGRGEQPSFYTSGPRSAKAGFHPRYLFWDDAYGEDGVDSQSYREMGIRWFEKAWLRNMPGTVWVVVGTLWAGEPNIHYHILEHVEKGKLPIWSPESEIMEGVNYCEGKYFNVLRMEDEDRAGNPIWPVCHPEDIQKQKDGMSEGMYLSQYKQRIVGSEMMNFDPSMFMCGEVENHWQHIGEPQPVSYPTFSYLVTDPALTVRIGKRRSKAALAIVTKTPDNWSYVREVHAGTLGQDAYLDTLIEVWFRWLRNAEETLVWIVMENTGPGAALQSHMLDRAKLQGHNPEEIIFHPNVDRHDTGSKHMRIQTVRPYLRKHQVRFSKNIEAEMITIRDNGEVVGMIPEEAFRYKYGDNRSYDIWDMFGDVYGKDGSGNDYCPPPEPETDSKKLTLQEKIHQDWLRRQQRTIVLR